MTLSAALGVGSALLEAASDGVLPLLLLALPVKVGRRAVGEAVGEGGASEGLLDSDAVPSTGEAVPTGEEERVLS